MNISKLPESAIPHLRFMTQTDNGRAFLAALAVLLDEAEQERDAAPRISDVFREDVRYRMGVVDGIRRALAIPDEMKNRATGGK